MLRTALFLCLALWAGCREQPPVQEDYVARVGTSYLSEADLAALAVVPAGMDSLTAREQIVEQWVTAELMAREAEQRGLRDRPDVQRQLVENERAVLAAALLGTLYDETPEAVGPAELEAYFARNKARLRLREPYVRVRFIETTSRERAEAAREAMQQAMLGAGQDSLWEVAARTFAADTATSLSLARSYVPESRLRAAEEPAVWQSLGQLGPGQIGPVIEDDEGFYVVQLVDRVPAGEEPRLVWIEDEVRRQITIQGRKQMLARHVQRLRTEADARGELEIRSVVPQDPPAPEVPAPDSSARADSARADA